MLFFIGILVVIAATIGGLCAFGYVIYVAVMYLGSKEFRQETNRNMRKYRPRLSSLDYTAAWFSEDHDRWGKYPWRDLKDEALRKEQQDERDQ